MSEYYTPDISEFHVGFEFEEFGHNGTREKVWFPKVLTLDELQWNRDGNDGPFDSSLAKYRVKCLDREDCLALGLEEIVWDNNSGYFKKDAYTIGIHSGFFTHISQIDYGNQIVRFSGNIKNKSELKRLMKQIGI